jgi:hypothetical protein
VRRSDARKAGDTSRAAVSLDTAQAQENGSGIALDASANVYMWRRSNVLTGRVKRVTIPGNFSREYLKSGHVSETCLETVGVFF